MKKLLLIFCFTGLLYPQGNLWKQVGNRLLPVNPAFGINLRSGFYNTTGLTIGYSTQTDSGTIRYNNTSLQYYNGSTWVTIATGSGGTANNADSLGHIYYLSYALKADSTIVSAGYGISVSRSNHTTTVSVDSTITPYKSGNNIFTGTNYFTARQYLTSEEVDTIVARSSGKKIRLEDSVKIKGYLGIGTDSARVGIDLVGWTDIPSGVAAKSSQIFANGLFLGTASAPIGAAGWINGNTAGTLLYHNSYYTGTQQKAFTTSQSSWRIVMQTTSSGSGDRFDIDRSIPTNGAQNFLTAFHIDSSYRFGLGGYNNNAGVRVGIKNGLQARIIENVNSRNIVVSYHDSSGGATFGSGVTLSYSGVNNLIINSTDNRDAITFQHNGTSKAFFGTALSANDLNTGLPAGGFGIRVQDNLFGVSTDKGNSQGLIVTQTNKVGVNVRSDSSAQFTVKNNLLANIVELYNSRRTLITSIDSIGKPTFKGNASLDSVTVAGRIYANGIPSDSTGLPTGALYFRPADGILRRKY